MFRFVHIFAPRNQNEEIMSKKHQLTKTDYLSTDEYQKLITGLHEDHDVLGETYARIAKATALRISDVLRIKWGQVLVIGSASTGGLTINVAQ